MSNIKKIVIITESSEWQNFKKAFPQYQVTGIASGGHIKQLKEDGGVNFKTLSPIYEWIPKPKTGPFKSYPSKKEIMSKINLAGTSADIILIENDRDREGTAIAWCIYNELSPSNKKKAVRIELNDWSKANLQEKVIDRNFAPTKIVHRYHNELPWLTSCDDVGIDTWMVAAQQARACLDQLMGYSLSRYIWGRVSGAKSLGRVQSPVLLMLLDRKNEIENFKSATSYGFQPIIHTEKPAQDLAIDLMTLNPKYKIPDGALYQPEDDKSKIIKFISKKELEKYISTFCPNNKFKLEGLSKTSTKTNPPLPFDTLTLNKVASSKFGWKIKKINEILEDLYKGSITTYPRSDSNQMEPAFIKKTLALFSKDTNISADLNNQAPEKFYFMKVNANAQAGHTCIQPVDMNNTPEKIKVEIAALKGRHSAADMQKMYEFIYLRTKLAFFKPSESENFTLTFDNNSSKFLGKFTNLTYAGWKKYMGGTVDDDEDLMSNNLDPSAYKIGQYYQAKSMGSSAFKTYITQPPKQYTNNTIIKRMKQLQIGRPSTIKTIFATLEARKYVTGGEGKKPLLLTELGLKVALEIKAHLTTVINYKFSAEMEAKLDEIAEGKNIYTKQMVSWLNAINKCLIENGMERYNQTTASSPIKKSAPVPVGKKCPKCGKPLVKRQGPSGIFYGCSGYPKCTYTEDPNQEWAICSKCGKKVKIFKWLNKKTGKQQKAYKCESCGNTVWDYKK